MNGIQQLLSTSPAVIAGPVMHMPSGTNMTGTPRPTSLRIDRTGPTDNDVSARSFQGSYIAIVGTKTESKLRASSVGPQSLVSHLKPDHKTRASSVGAEILMSRSVLSSTSPNTAGHVGLVRSQTPEPKSDRLSGIPVNRVVRRSLTPDLMVTRKGSPEALGNRRGSPDLSNANRASPVPDLFLHTGSRASTNSVGPGSSISMSNQSLGAGINSKTDFTLPVTTQYTRKDYLKDFGPLKMINPTRGLQKFSKDVKKTEDGYKGRNES